MTVIATELETTVRGAAKEKMSDGVVALHLGKPDGRPLAPWTAGAHLDLILGDAPTRQYSLSEDPAVRSSYRIGVFRGPIGRGRSLHDGLRFSLAGPAARPRPLEPVPGT